MPKITKQTLDALAPNGADRFIWDEGDGALKGFGVRMSPAGVGSFLVQYRTAGGRRGQRFMLASRSVRAGIRAGPGWRA